MSQSCPVDCAHLLLYPSQYILLWSHRFQLIPAQKLFKEEIIASRSIQVSEESKIHTGLSKLGQVGSMLDTSSGGTSLMPAKND